MTIPIMPDFFAGGPGYAGDLNQLGDAIDAQGIIGASVFTGGPGPTSTGLEVALTAWTAEQNPWTFKNGHVYAMRCQCLVYNGAAAFTTINRCQVRLRKAVNSITAQVLGNTASETFGTSTNGARQQVWTSYIVNTTGADVTCRIGMTVQRLLPATDGNTFYGDATFPMFIIGEDAGLASNVPNIAAIAISIT